jgi:hypothetical protein
MTRIGRSSGTAVGGQTAEADVRHAASMVSARSALRTFSGSRADCLAIVRGNAEQLVALLPSVSVDLLDFTKTPMSPYDTYLDVVRGLLPGQGRGLIRKSQQIDDGPAEVRLVRPQRS